MTLSFWLTNSIEIPLPAAARPVDFWLQRVILLQDQLFTDDAFRVQAN